MLVLLLASLCFCLCLCLHTCACGRAGTLQMLLWLSNACVNGLLVTCLLCLDCPFWSLCSGRGDWLDVSGKYVELTLTDNEFTDDFFYFCHIHKGMSGQSAIPPKKKIIVTYFKFWVPAYNLFRALIVHALQLQTLLPSILLVPTSILASLGSCATHLPCSSCP